MTEKNMKNRLSLMLATLVCLSYVSIYGQELAWTPQVGVATASSDDKLTPSLTPYVTKNMNITDDGVGGMIMCWSNGSQNGSAIFAQRVDAFGKLKWTTAASGFHVHNTGNDGPRVAQCVGDGSGGAYIGWAAVDSVSGLDKQFLQHISATGALLWGLNGVMLTPAGASALASSSNASILQMDKDGAGGVLVTWYSITSDPSQGNVHVARINGSGSAPVFVWGPVTVLPRSLWQSAVTSVDPVVISDGSGGAYVAGVVTDVDTNFYACLAHMDAAGVTVFDKQVITSSSPFHAAAGFQLVADVNGAVLAYVQASNAVSNLDDQSYAISRKSIKIVAAEAGANNDKASLSFDDNELSDWVNDGNIATAWIKYTLAKESTISAVSLKLNGFRTKIYPLRILVDGKVAFEGNSKPSLGYFTANCKATKGKTVTIQLVGSGKEKENAYIGVEVNGKKLDDGVDRAETKLKGGLSIIEAEIYEQP